MAQIAAFTVVAVVLIAKLAAPASSRLAIGFEAAGLTSTGDHLLSWATGGHVHLFNVRTGQQQSGRLDLREVRQAVAHSEGFLLLGRFPGEGGRLSTGIVLLETDGEARELWLVERDVDRIVTLGSVDAAVEARGGVFELIPGGAMRPRPDLSPDIGWPDGPEKLRCSSRGCERDDPPRWRFEDRLAGTAARCGQYLVAERRHRNRAGWAAWDTSNGRRVAYRASRGSRAPHFDCLRPDTLLDLTAPGAAFKLPTLKPVRRRLCPHPRPRALKAVAGRVACLYAGGRVALVDAP